ncbi:MAG: HPr family phosphocarrier protein [Clostridium sp.]
MLKKTITIGLSSGLEARPVAMLVQIASQFDSQIYVENNNARVNAKSIMGMMTLGMGAGEDIAVVMLMEDDETIEALDNIEKILRGLRSKIIPILSQKLSLIQKMLKRHGWK